MSLLSPLVDALNAFQPIANTVINVVNDAFWIGAVVVSFIVTAQ